MVLWRRFFGRLFIFPFSKKQRSKFKIELSGFECFLLNIVVAYMFDLFVTLCICMYLSVFLYVFFWMLFVGDGVYACFTCVCV